jgi:hypothetical protein
VVAGIAVVLAARAAFVVLVVLAAVFALAVAPSAAQAGEYHVYSCRTPSGQVAPTDGWSAPEHPEYEHGVTLNTCEAGGGLLAALDANYAHYGDTERATWQFEAPTDETIAGATLWRAGDTLGGSNEHAYYVIYDTGFASKGEKTQVFDSCKASNACLQVGELNNPFGKNNLVAAPAVALNSPYLSLNASCGSAVYGIECPVGSGDPNHYDAMVELFAADLVLSQSTAPTVSAVGGGLAEDPTVSGTSDVAFDASDSGSGVYEAIFQVDGQTVSHGVLDEDGGRCRDVGDTGDGLPAFLYTQPCPAALSVDVPFATTGLANGVHHLVVSVTDAAGNATTVLDREITVANPVSPDGGSARGAVNGADPSERATLSARWKGHSGARLGGRYGAARTIEGRLSGPEGKGIADAEVEVGELPAYTGAPLSALAAPRTDAQGDWSLALPRGLSSCELRIVYRSHLGDALPAATRTLTLTVRAALRLRISPRIARADGAIRFDGSLLGGPIPPGGKQLVLEARSPGGPWIEFHVIRTRAHARFAYLYRFRLAGPARYQFRVLSEQEADYPFAAGASNVVEVLER